MHIYLTTLCVFLSWKSPSVSEQVSPAAVALQRTVASPKHSIFNPQNTTSTTPNQHTRDNPLTVPRQSITHRQRLSKEQGMTICTASIFSPQFCVQELLLSTPGWKSSGVRARLCLQGRLQIRTWQLQSPRSSGSRHCRPVQSSTYRGENSGAGGSTARGCHERTPKQPRSLESASRFVLSHLHGSTAQPPDGHGPAGSRIRRIWGKFPAPPRAERIPGAAPPSPPRKQWKKPKTRAGIESTSPIH